MKTSTTFSLPLQWICNQGSNVFIKSKNKLSIFLIALLIMLAIPFTQTKADTNFVKTSITITPNTDYLNFKVLGVETDGTDDELDQLNLYYLDPQSGKWVKFFAGDMDSGDDVWEKNDEEGTFPLVSGMRKQTIGTKKYGYLDFNYPKSLFQSGIVIKAEVDWDIDSNETNSLNYNTFYYSVAVTDDLPWNTFWNTSYDETKNTLSFSFENCELYARGIDKVVDPKFPEEYKTRNELDSIIIEYEHPVTKQWIKVIAGNCNQNFNDTIFNLASKTSDGIITAKTQLAADRKFTYQTTVVWDKLPPFLWGKTVKFRYNADWDLMADETRLGFDQNNTFYVTINSPRKPVIQSAGCVYSAENQEVVLKWLDSNTSTTPEIRYHIKRKLKTSANYDFITPAEGVKDKQFIDKNFVNWKEYEYKIYSVPTSWGWTKDELLEDYSITYNVSTNPKIPRFENFKLTAYPTKETDAYIKINWENEWIKENTVKLYHRESSSPEFTLLETLSPGATSYTDAYEIHDNSKHFYKLVVDVFGVVKEKIDSVTVVKLVEFTNVAASKNTIGDRIQLSWEIDDLDLCDRFEIYRSYTHDSSGIDVKTKPEMIHQLSAQTQLNKWDDLTAVAGVVYEYEIYAYNKGGDGVIRMTKSNSDIGFRTPVGTISGRITYGGGTAVDKVSVYVQSSSLDDNMLYKSLLLKGENSQKSQVNLTNARHGCIKNGFSFQSWITSSRPVKYTPVFELSNEYSIGIRNDSVLAFIGTFNLAKPSIKCKLDSIIQLNDFFHLSVTLDTKDSVKIYLNGNLRAKAVLTVSASTHVCTFTESDKVDGTVVTPKTKCYIGNKTNETLTTVGAYSGNIDDIRLWSRNITASEISSNFNRYLSGTESGLIGYWPLDEGINSYAFDCSKTNQKFNEHHIKLVNSYTSANVPSKEQLAIKGITDSDGNYIIRGIPFTGEGSTYAIKPVLGTHKFEPTQLMRYISPSSLIHNSSDFADKSSFPVIVKVIYNNTQYPVTGVSFSIDDNPCSKENKLITTNSVRVGKLDIGECIIDVPIGEHYIKASLGGHGFKYNGRYPVLGKEIFDENSAGTTITFLDTTLVTVAGRVVGGAIEAAYPIGFRKSNANVGKAKIVFEPSLYKDYLLTPNTKSLDTASEFGKWDTKRFLKNSVNIFDKRVVVFTDDETGEYMVKLPPIKWDIDTVRIFNDASYDINNSTDLLYNQIQSFQTSTLENYTDTLTIKDINNVNKVDTFKYNIKKSFTHKVTATIEVRSAGSEYPMAFGESKWNLNEAGTETLALYNYSNALLPGDVAYTFGKDDDKYKKGKPIFFQKENYRLKIKAYEKYTHPSSNAQSFVPLKGATVIVKNELGVLVKSIQPSPTDTTPNHVMKLDENGQINYIFKAGFPNTAALKEGLEMRISVQNGNENPIVWDEMGTFKGIVLGCEPIGGTNHITKGPTVPLVVLRDPPGSNSYSYMEEGSKISYNFTSKTIFNGSFDVQNQMALGVGYKVGAGLGFMVITQIEELNSVTAGLEGQYASFTGETKEKSITLKERVQTSNSPEFVGSKADVYIGVSTNIFYCNSNLVTINSNKDLVKVVVSSGNIETSTNFKYTQNEILTQQIPLWQKRMQAVLKTVNTDVAYNQPTEFINKANQEGKNYYITKVAQNSDTLGLNPRYYKVIRPSGTNYENEVDTIAKSILGWRKVIADNEEAKYKIGQNDKYTVENLSFDAGVTIDKSYTYTDRAGNTDGDSDNTQGTLATEFGLNINSLGMKINAETKIGGGKDEQSETATEKTLTYGFVLADSDPDNRFSVDVYKNKYLDKSVTELKSLGKYEKVADNLGSYIFKLAAGQSSCPLEREDSTVYYKGKDADGNLLMSGNKLKLANGTFALDVPYIQIDNSEKWNIPNGKAANFVLKLGSNSDMQTTRGYMLSVVDSTNKHGAVISIDGQPLVGGRLFYVTKGQLIDKTLTLKQTKLDVLDYKDIKIRLASPCDTSIYMDKTISVHYVPSCSDLDMTLDRQIINADKSGDLVVKLSNFNQEYGNFLGLRIEYKMEGSTAWQSKVLAKNDSTKSILEQQKSIVVEKLLQEKNSKLVSFFNYNLPVKELAYDGNYVFRAITLCNDLNNTNGVISNITPEIIVTKDLERPAVMGSPSPSNGILTPETELAVTFNEDIQASRLIPGNFEVKGVLNGATLQHSEGLALAGNEKSEAFTESAISLQNSSFAIEAWVRTTNTANETPGKIFSIGEGENNVTLKMSAKEIFLFVNNKMVGSSGQFTASLNWKYLSLNYDAVNNIIKVHLLESSTSKTVISVSAVVNPNGRLIVGTGFLGNIHQVTVWKESRQISDLTDMNDVKTGKETNIVGYWPMNEGYGKQASDKVSSRNMIVNSSWFIEPSGYSIQFDAAKKQSMAINTSSIPLTTRDNFSVEFWFNGNNQQNATLFSCGKGVSDPDSINKISVGFNDMGLLNLKTKGLTFLIPGASLLDSVWHHFALSVMRGGNSNIFIDGQQKLQIPSSKIGGMASDSIVIGALRYTDTVVVEQKKVLKKFTEQYFQGKMDELRIWNSALGSENIRLDMRSKLSGEEPGLIAYYPFEIIEPNEGGVDKIKFSKNDLRKESELVGVYANYDPNASYSSITPGIKIPRKKEDVSFTYTASQNKIIFNIAAPLKKIENCILEFAVKTVYDMNGNNLSSPVKWTAYVNNNRLNWETEKISLTKEVLAPASFKATIVNNSGKYENYVVDGLPSWLSVNKTSGRLNPLEKTELIFTIDNSVNIGNYESRVTLTGNNDIQEMLPVSLKVTGTRPDWTVNPYDFESSMNITGKIKIEGVGQEDSQDMLAAFIGTKCVGVVNPQFNKTLNSYILYMDVYGNAENESKPITFSLWDAGTGRIYPGVNVIVKDIITPLIFSSGSIVGVATDMVIFDATDKVEQQLSIKKGWNWISTNVVNTSPTLINQIKTGMEADGISLKWNTKYTNYSASTSSWFGSLTSVDQLSMYLLHAAQPKALKIVGATAKPSELPITINEGWNWIGYIPQFVSPVKEALSSIEKSDGDQIKGQIGFATFSGGNWYGSLEYLVPGQGYMYKSKSTITNNKLIYPSQYISRSNTKRKVRSEESMHWTFNIGDYNQNMVVTAIVKIDDVEWLNENLQIAAFIDNKCRGTINLINEPSLNRSYAFVTVLGDGQNDYNKKITFKCYNPANGKELVSSDTTIPFISNSDIGTVENPYVIAFSSVTTDQSNLVSGGKVIYPNPVVNTLNFNYDPQGIGRIEIVDGTGRIQVLSTSINKNYINVADLLPGIYTLRVNYKGTNYSHRFIKN